MQIAKITGMMVNILNWNYTNRSLIGIKYFADYNKNEYVRSLDANLRNWSKYVYNSSVFNIKNEPVQMLAFGKNVYSVGDSKGKLLKSKYN